jgi:integrase
MSATQPIRNKNQIRELAEHCLKRDEPRNHLLIVMGIHTALRIGDLLRLKWNDVYDFEHKRVRDTIEISEQKTGKSKIVKLNNEVVAALNLCVPRAQRGDFLLKSRKGENKAISRIQAYRIIRTTAEELGFNDRVSCHSLRKTFGYHAWKNGTNPAVIMDIYNHTSLAVTRRYLGITQDDKNAVYDLLGTVV